MAKNKISIDFPISGEWRILRPPGHHPFAFDFVKMDDNKKRYSRKNKFIYYVSTISSNEYYSWNQNIYSPIDGKVIQIGTGIEDRLKTNIWNTINIWYNATYRFKPEEKNGRLDIRTNTGNYLMIQAKEGYTVLLAHLMNNSINVSLGQSLQVGDIVGKVGNSGNLTMPHLHINIFDQIENPLKSKVLPFVFSEYEELQSNGIWKKSTFSVPKIKAHIIAKNCGINTVGRHNV